MAEIKTSASFPNGAQCTRSEAEARASMNMAQVINLAAARKPLPGLSDDDLAAEYTAQKLAKKAVEDFKAAIEAINDLSSVIQISGAAFDDFLHDQWPCDESWDEMIAKARS